MALTHSASQPTCKYISGSSEVSGDLIRLEALRSELATALVRDHSRATAIFVAMDTVRAPPEPLSTTAP